MNKIVLKSVVALATLTAVAPIAASAAEATYSTKAGVEFVAGITGTTPIDPSNPTITIDPVNPDDSKPTPPAEVTPGLTLDFASTLAFGTQEISTNNKTYYAHAQKYTDNSTGSGAGITPDYAQVTDVRGTFGGWTLSVALDGQFREAGTDITTTPQTGAALGTYLTGAELTFSKGVANGTVTATGAKPENVLSKLTLSDQDQVIMSAKVNQGMGTWTYALGATADYDASATGQADVAGQSPITLDVPGSTAKKAAAYETNLIWKLSDTPAN